MGCNRGGGHLRHEIVESLPRYELVSEPIQGPLNEGFREAYAHCNNLMISPKTSVI